MMRLNRTYVLALVTIMFTAVLVCLFMWMQLETSFSQAKDLAKHGLWNRTRIELAAYLRFHPHNEQALLLMAESLVKDETVEYRASVEESLRFLARIPSHSPAAEQARLQEARLNLLLLHRPQQAEQRLKEALLLNPKNVEAILLSMKIHELTGRYYQTEDLFWQAYELSDVDGRPIRLREWYMTQFFPLSANETLDRRMGFLAENEEPSATSESVRYISFRENEKQGILGHAAVAAWLQREGQPAMALEMLERTEKHVPNPNADAFFLAIRIATLFDLGELDLANAAFQQWPINRSSYDFWKWKAILTEETGANLSAAADAYNAALGIWPGPTDWRLRYRRANCLLQMGKHQAAAEERDRAEAIEKLMQDDVHFRLRQALHDLHNPKALQFVVDFYRRLERHREADAWSQHVLTLNDSKNNSIRP